MKDKNAITAQKVPVSKQLDMFPKYFKQHFMTVQNHVYFFMDKLCREYDGGEWELYELSNGGFYMCIDSFEPTEVEWTGNAFNRTMSMNAASITAYLFALNHVFMTHSDDRFLIDVYTKVIDFVYGLDECDLIFRALD